MMYLHDGARECIVVPWVPEDANKSIVLHVDTQLDSVVCQMVGLRQPTTFTLKYIYEPLTKDENGHYHYAFTGEIR